jgi:hypothetical protein
LIWIKPTPFGETWGREIRLPLETGRQPMGADAMRSVLVLSLSVILLASADAATVHHARPPANLPARAHSIAHPGPAAAPAARFSVPGWSDEQTRQWLDNATSCEGCG